MIFVVWIMKYNEISEYSNNIPPEEVDTDTSNW